MGIRRSSVSKLLFVLFASMAFGDIRAVQASCPVSSPGSYYMSYDTVTNYITACTFGNSLSNICASDDAACGDPGSMQYDSTNNVMRYCKGTNWYNIDCIDSGDSCAGTTAGTIQVNSGDLQYCNGTNWYGFFFDGICSGIGVQEAVITPSTSGDEGEQTILYAWNDSVGMTDDFLIVGSKEAADATYGISSGQATLYQRSGGTWSRVKELGRSTGGRFHDYGSAVDMYGDYAVVSADQNERIYIYKKDQGGANNWGEIKTYRNGNLNRYGLSLDISDNHIIAGAELESASGKQYTGAFSILRKNYGGADNWGEVVEVLNPDTANDDRSRFGSDVGIDGDTAVIGAYEYDDPSATGAGAAYIYYESSLDNWTYLKKLTSPNGLDANDNFGLMVEIDDVDENGTADRMAISARRDDDAGGDAGAIFIYERNQGGANNWGLVKTVTLSPPGTAQYLGEFGMRLVGNRLVATSRLDDTQGTNAGAVFTFEKDTGGANNWGLESTVYASSGNDRDEFGRSFGMSDSGNYMAVGAPYEENGTDHPGKVYTYNLSGTTWSEQSVLTPNTALEFSTRMGDSVSITGDYLAVAPQYKSTLFSSDSLYLVGGVDIYTRSAGGTWTFQQSISPDNPGWGMQFGQRIQISPTILAVSVPGDDTGPSNSGGAHIYGRDVGGVNNWGYVTELKHSDAQYGDSAGSGQGLSLFGDYVALGVQLEDGNLVFPDRYAGAAYIFKRNAGGTDNWGEIKAIKPPVEQHNARFGQAVDIGSQFLIVGAYAEDTGAFTNNGAAYLYERDNGGIDNWGYTGKKFEGEATGDEFGESVAIAGYTMAIGAPRDDTAGGDRGAVYIYEKDLGGVDNWGLRKKITYPGASSGSVLFGESIDLSGDVLVVGGQYDDTNGTDSGRVYVFMRDEGGTNNWGQVAVIEPDSPAADDRFGSSVAVSGNIVGAGGLFIDDGGIDDGGVYVFGCPSTGGPDPFDFGDQIGSGLTTSNDIITMTGISGSVPVSISGDGSPEFSVDGGAWSTTGTISNGQTLQLRLTSTFGSYVATVDVNGVTDDWTVTAPP